MGAYEFHHQSSGKTAQEAFSNAVDEARYEYGHGGYTGTIAEKHSFVKIPVPEGKDPHRYAEELIEQDDDRIEDKWGPAGCISLGNDQWLFFGWASS